MVTMTLAQTNPELDIFKSKKIIKKGGHRRVNQIQVRGVGVDCRCPLFDYVHGIQPKKIVIHRRQMSLYHAAPPSFSLNSSSIAHIFYTLCAISD